MGPALVVGTDSARTVVATARAEEVSLWEAKSGRRLRRFITPEMPFLGAPLIAVSPDASATVTAGYSGVVIWDGAAAGTLLVPDEENTHIKAVAFSRDDEVLVADRFSLRFVDLVGRIRNENVPGDDILGVRLSPDGNSIVVVFREQAEILDRKTFKRLCTLQGEYVRAAAFSPDSKFIAGATKGKVGIWDARSGDLLRTARPPGRYRPPWTLPATALVVWLLACWQISKRRLARRTGIEAK